MQILPILNTSEKFNHSFYCANPNKNINTTDCNLTSTYYLPYNLSFQALSIQKTLSKGAPKIYEEFSNSEVNFVDFLKKQKSSPETIFRFLCFATSDEKTSLRVAGDLSKDVRKSDKYKNLLIEKLGGGKAGEAKFLTWLCDDRFGYRKAYNDYYRQTIWNSAANLDDVIKQQPNIAPWCFKAKANELKIEPTLGKLPEEFGTIENFRELITILKDYDRFIHKSKAEKLKEIENLGISDELEKAKLVNRALSDGVLPLEVNLNGEMYTATPVKKSFSAKLIYEFTSQKNPENSYILKFIPYDTDFGGDYGNKFYENYALRPDLPYMNAVVDFYLKYNNCPNALDAEFFDYKTQAYLYKKAQGKFPSIPEKYADNLYNFQNFSKIADVKKLGLELNDPGAGNFIETKDGTYKLIDSGHSYYTSTFRPQVIGISFTLGSLCGREVLR